MNKLVGLNELAELSDSLKKEGKRLVHCHGVFDLLHPGHIIHLEEARGLGDVLVVSLTASPYVNKGPGRPYFNDSERLRTIAALGCVDYVILSESKTPMDIIASLKPDVYVKGREYAVAEDDVTGNIDVEAEEVKKYGGRVHFTGGVVYSSTKLLNNNFPVIDPPVREHMLEFIKKYSFTDVRNIVEQMCSMRVLVIGDVIIDEYVMCGIQGLTSKDLAYSARYQKEERYPGGSLAIARHAAEFSCNVCLSSLVGGEAHLNSFIEDTLADCLKLDVFSDPEITTTVKRRYLTQRGMRNEFEKIFSVNYIDEKAERTSHVRHGFMKWLEENLEQFDLVLLADYGHGLVDKEMMDLIQNKAKYLALNCQTNSSNLGTNLITKYRRADIITLDERELKMAMSRVSEEEKVMMEVLVSQLDCELGWLTKGAAGSWCVGKNTTYYNHPALTRTVQDTVGAGDAFFVLACMAIRAGGNVEIASFLANIAGALAATTLGNAKSVRKDELLKFAATLMKQ